MTAPDDHRLSAAALHRLAAWLSPSFPIGAYSYSHGLEWAIEGGAVDDRATLVEWIDALLAAGGGRVDAGLLAAAWRARAAGDAAALAEAAALGAALANSAERRLETLAQGRAFARAVAEGWDAPLDLPEETPYPVAVGAAAAAAGAPLEATLQLYLHAFAANLISAGLRLIPLGQTDGQRALAALEAPIAKAAAGAAASTGLDDLGGCAFRSDLAAMRHETQRTRLFRT